MKNIKKKVTKKVSVKKNVRNVSMKASEASMKVDLEVSLGETEDKIAKLQSVIQESVSTLGTEDSQMIAFVANGQKIIDVQNHKKNKIDYKSASRQIKMLAKEQNTNSSSIIEETFLNMLNHISDDDTDEKVRSVLKSHGLLIHADRRNLDLCFYEPIDGGLSKKELKRFLNEHDGHHLGIFSLERETRVSCYYIVDVFQYIQKQSNLSITDILSHTLVQWENFNNILVPHRTNKNGDDMDGDVFSARELALIVQWYVAYMKFETIIKNKKDVSNILAHGDRIIPMYTEVDTRNFLRRFIGDTYDKIVQYASEKLQSTFSGMWKLISTKLMIDIFSTVSCFLSQGFIYRNLITNAQTRKFLFAVIDEYILGGIISGIIRTYRGVTEGTGTYLSIGLGWLKSGLSLLGFGKFGDFLFTVINTIEIFFPKTLYGTATAGVGLLLMSGPVGVMAAIPSILTTTLWSAGIELLANKWELMAKLILPGTNMDAGLSYVIQMLQPTFLCSMLPFYKGRCQTVASKIVKLKGWIYVIMAILDILRDIGSVSGICEPSNRCLTLFKTISTQNMSNTSFDPSNDTSFDEIPLINGQKIENHHPPNHTREEITIEDDKYTFYRPRYNSTPYYIPK